jgi:hypothetical protein
MSLLIIDSYDQAHPLHEDALLSDVYELVRERVPGDGWTYQLVNFPPLACTCTWDDPDWPGNFAVFTSEGTPQCEGMPRVAWGKGWTVVPRVADEPSAAEYRCCDGDLCLACQGLD